MKATTLLTKYLNAMPPPNVQSNRYALSSLASRFVPLYFLCATICEDREGDRKEEINIETNFYCSCLSEPELPVVLTGKRKSVIEKRKDPMTVYAYSLRCACGNVPHPTSAFRPRPFGFHTNGLFFSPISYRNLFATFGI